MQQLRPPTVMLNGTKSSRTADRVGRTLLAWQVVVWLAAVVVSLM